MGKMQRNKGYRGEHNLVRILKESGIKAKRIPLSGATEFQKGDVQIQDFIAEVKLRKNGFKQIYKWLENSDILFIKADRKPYLAVIPLELLVDLLQNQR